MQKNLKPYVNVGEAIAGYDGPEYYEDYENPIGGTYYNELCEVPPGMNYKALRIGSRLMRLRNKVLSMARVLRVGLKSLGLGKSPVRRLSIIRW